MRQGKRQLGMVGSTVSEYQLVKKVLGDFLLNFAPGIIVMYIGDEERRFIYSDEAGLSAMGIKVFKPKRMPDAILYYPPKNWLFLLDMLMGKGPITMKRRAELVRMFATSTAELIFCSVFRNLENYLPHCSRIAWNTEVWLTDSPTHMIHYR